MRPPSEWMQVSYGAARGIVPRIRDHRLRVPEGARVTPTLALYGAAFSPAQHTVQEMGRGKDPVAQSLTQLSTASRGL